MELRPFQLSQWGLRSQIGSPLTWDVALGSSVLPSGEERAPRPTEPPAAAVFLGSTGALSRSPRGGRTSVIPGGGWLRAQRRDTISHTWLPVYSEPACPGSGGLGQSTAHTPSPSASAPVKGEIRLVSLGLSFPRGTGQEGAG